MNLNITPRLTTLIVGMLICCATSWANTNDDYSGTIETTTSCDLSFTTDLIGVFCNEDRGNIVVNIMGGTAPFRIEWDNNDFSIWAEIETTENSYTITGVPSGLYKIQVRDAFGCIQKQDVYLRDQESTIDLTVTNNSSSCDTEGSIAVVVGNGTPPYWVTLDGPTPQGLIVNESVFTLDGLEGGEYTVNVRQERCDATSTIKVITNTNSLALQVSEIATCSGSFASVATNITGGHPNYRLYFDGPTSGLTQSTGPKLVQNLAPGTYNFTVIDQEGCSVSQELEVGQDNRADVDFSAQGLSGACGTTGRIAVEGISGVAPFVLSWKGPRSSSVVIDDGDAFNIMDLPAGIYEVQVEDVRGCTFSNLVEVGESSIGVQFNAAGQGGLCGGGSSFIRVSEIVGTAPYTVSWTGPASGSASIGDVTSYDIQDLPSGDYVVTIVDSNGCTFNRNVWVPVSSTGVQFNAAGQGGLCGGGSSFIRVSEIVGTAPYTVSWTGPASGSASIGDVTSYDIQDLPSGDYVVTIVDSNGCTFNRNVWVPISSTGVQFNAAGQGGLCGGSSFIRVSEIVGTAPYTVSWTGPASGSASIGDVTSYDIQDLPSGDYVVTIVDSNGCTFNRNVWVEPSSIGVQFNAAAQGGLCGGSGSISVTGITGTAPFDLSWWGPASGSTVVGDVGSFDIQDLPAGDYEVTIVDANLCTFRRLVSVNVGNSDVSLTAEATANLCTQTGDIWVTPSGGTGSYTLTWSGPTQGSASINTNGFSITGLPSGIYSLIVTDQNGCSATQEIEFNITTAFLMYDLTSTSAINGQNGSINVAFQNGIQPYTVSWTGPVSNFIRTNGPSQNIDNLPAGTYSITVTDSNGCFAIQQIVVANTSRITNLNFSAEPSDQIGSTGGVIRVLILQGSAPYTVSWTGAASGTVVIDNIETFIRNLSAGTYSITVTDRDGNFGIQTVVVGFQEARSFVINVGVTNAVCSSNGSINASWQNGVSPYHVSWTGSSSGSLTAKNTSSNISLPAGNYVVTITDARGESRSAVANIGVSPSNLVLTINGGDGRIDFLFGSGTPNYTITLSGPKNLTQIAAGNTTISGLAAGLYRATIVDSNGCTVSQLVRVNGNDVMPEETQPVSNLTSNETANVTKKNLIKEELEDRSILTLKQNYPNPSSNFTNIPFDLTEAMDVSLTVQDRFGKIVKEVHRSFEIGNNQIEINGNELTTGIYYYTLTVGSETQTMRMMITH